MTYDLFVFAGETSGDIHGAAILEALKKLRPDIRICGVAGPKMRKAGLSLFMPMENFQVMGYSDVFKNLLPLIYSFKKILRHILEQKPKAVLFIDYPGFNLRMAKALRKKGFSNRLIHYICPTVWAHGKKRMSTLTSTLDLLLSIFPFEAKYFEKTSLKPAYVGHPLIEALHGHPPDANWKSKYGIPLDKPLIGLFPGSRVQEIKQNLPKILRACEIFLKEHPDRIFVLSVASQSLKYHIHQAINASSLTLDKNIFPIPGAQNPDIMRDVTAAIATSGTITFELGIMSVPTVVVYHLSLLNALIAKYFLKLNLPYYCIVNIITQKHVFPELYHINFIPKDVARNLGELCSPSYLRKNSLRGCEEMLSIMHLDKSPSLSAAEKIHTLIYE